MTISEQRKRTRKAKLFIETIKYFKKYSIFE